MRDAGAWLCVILRTPAVAYCRDNHASLNGTAADSQGTYMRIEPEISGVSIVLVGKFNPAIFTPAWFALHDLLPAGVAENAELQVAHQHITSFNADWLRFEVTLEVCKFETLQAPHIRVADLAIRTFREHLSHTPLAAAGINRDVHFRVRDEAERDRIGRALVPVAPWGRWREELDLDGLHGGMTSVTMSQLRPAERPHGGRINIKVEPSHRVSDTRLGVYVNVNDHYDIDHESLDANARLMQLVEDHFEPSIQRSADIIDHIMSLATPQEP